MATPTYTTDLTNVNTAESTTNWTEMTGRTSGGAPTLEDRAYIQGSYSISQSTGVATGRTVGLQYDYGSNISWTSGWVFLFWQYWQAPMAIGSWSNGGMRVGVGSSAGNVKLWNAQGNDKRRNPYGGWDNIAIDPTFTADETIGSPVSGQYRIFCSAPYLITAVNKGNPHCVDAIRYGRGKIIVEYGEYGSYANFDGMAAANDNQSAKWGLFSFQNGIYLWKGMMALGTASNLIDFRDANKNIIIDNTPRTYRSFNKVEISNSNSKVYWTAISFQSLPDSTYGNLSPGQIEVIDDCDVRFINCTFTDMDTFIFKPSSVINNCIFRRCNTITANGADFTGTLFDSATVDANTSQLVWNVNLNPISALSNCNFIKGNNAHHAIEFGTNSPTSITLTKMEFSGFNTSNGQNDSAIHILRTSGTVTITLSGTSQPSYKSEGATVEFITDTRTVKVIVQNIEGTKISGANVFLAVGESGGLPYKASVTIVNSGNTAIVTHSSHGLSTNDKVFIEGASIDANNGVFVITKIDNNTYSYTMSSSPGSNPTGSITSTFVFLKGTTDVNGEISMSRQIPGTQLAVGWARKSSEEPFYKQGALRGNVLSSADTIFSAILIRD